MVKTKDDWTKIWNHLISRSLSHLYMHHPLWVTPNLNFFFTSIKIIPVASTLLFIQIQQAWSWGVQYFKFRNSCGIVRPSCSRANHTTACKHHSTLNKVNGFFIFRNLCGFKSSVLIPASNDFRSQFDLLNISFTPFFLITWNVFKGSNRQCMVQWNP